MTIWSGDSLQMLWAACNDTTNEFLHHILDGKLSKGYGTPPTGIKSTHLKVFLPQDRNQNALEEMELPDDIRGQGKNHHDPRIPKTLKKCLLKDKGNSPSTSTGRHLHLQITAKIHKWSELSVEIQQCYKGGKDLNSSPMKVYWPTKYLDRQWPRKMP